MSNEPSAAYNPRARPRPTLSCLSCRRKKLRCDRAQPCEQCVRSRRSAQCTYAVDPSISQSTNSYDENDDSPRKRARTGGGTQQSNGLGTNASVLRAIEDLQARVAELEKQANTISNNGLNTAAVPASEIEHSISERYNGRVQGCTAAEGTCAEIEEIAKDSIVVKENRTRLRRDIRQKLRKQFPEALDLMIKAAMTDSLAMSAVQEVHALQKIVFRARYQVRRCDLNRLQKPAVELMLETLPPRDLCDDIIDKYFEYWEKVHRVLHIPTFYQDYEQFMDRRDSQQPVLHSSFLPLLTAVIALACASNATHNDCRPKTYSEVGDISVADRCYLLREWSFRLPRKERLDIRTLQSQVLLVLAEQVLFTPSDILWQSMGSIVRTAMTMGLHYDASGSQKLSGAQKEVRKRLWLTLVELDLQLATASGMPPLTDMTKETIFFPLNVNDSDLSNVDSALPQGQGKETQTDVTGQILLTESLLPRLDAAKLASSIPSHLAGSDRVSLGNATLQALEDAATTRGRYNVANWIARSILQMNPNTEAQVDSRYKKACEILSRFCRLSDDHRIGGNIERHLFFANFKTDIQKAILYLCEGISDGSVTDISDVREGIETLAGTIGVLGGDLKDVLGLAAVSLYVSEDYLDVGVMRKGLMEVVDVAHLYLSEVAEDLEPMECAVHAPEGVGQNETPLNVSDYGSFESDLFDFSELAMDFDLDWYGTGL
ncbi:hypothetical protein NA57DRAFT_73822 [Rhizodiscina lignyota]|uniref:Zn(2)-C6 fungal-type domain-containing protein n=1 Tax=Rhizodiscina lignyota TaxID=1504668 RepID=A0A9P4MC04_9PEZI|nr:hypothetical protein NA57DRAFT_73822 [Rhizodiscina lignyota]